MYSYHPDTLDQAEVEKIEDTNFGDDKLYVVYDGRIEVQTMLDDNNIFELEYLTKGSVIRPFHFLVNRINKVKFKVKE